MDFKTFEEAYVKEFCEKVIQEDFYGWWKPRYLVDKRTADDGYRKMIESESGQTL